MAIRFDTTGDFISRSTSLPNYNSTYTVMGWFYQQTDTNAVAIMFLISNTAVTQLDALAFPADGTTLQLQSNVSTVTGSAMPLQTWTHLAMVRESATSWKLYVNGVLDITNTGNVGTGRTLNSHVIGGLAASHLFNGRVFGYKQFATAFTIEEVQRAMHTIRPASLATAWSPMWPGATERLADYSGNGLNWTANGTLTDEDPPPVSYGSPIIFYPITVSAGAQTISPSGIASTALVGEPTLTSAATISPSSIDSTTTVGNHTLSGAATISPSSVDSTALVGEPTLTSAAIINPGSITATITLGDLTLTGAATISPLGISSTLVVGDHSIGSIGTILPSGVDSTTTIGNPVLSSTATISPGSVASTTTIGQPSISLEGLISPTGIDSTVTIGNPIITSEDLLLCIYDGNIDLIILMSSVIIVEEMILTSSTATPTGDHDWTI